MTRIIVCISDTHNKLKKISVPDGDILIHAGDATGTGSLQELLRFNKEIGLLPHPVKIFVPGNHDIECENNHSFIKNTILTNITHYLVDSVVEIEGHKIYGSPWQPEFCDWAFNLPRGPLLKQKWDKIPDDTDILITHGPPYGTLDVAPGGDMVGCEELAARVLDIDSLKTHIFGHIHDCYGVVEKNGVRFVNASSCNENYQPTNPPLVFDI